MFNQTPPRTQFSTTKTYDVEASSSDSRKLADEIVLQVLDARYDGTLPTDPHLFKFSDNIAEKLRGLPIHEGRTARIFDVTVYSDFVITGLRDTKGPKTTQSVRDDLINHLKITYTEPFQERQIFRWLTDPLLVNDIGSISSQWSQHLGSGCPRLSRLVNRTSLQQHPLDYDVRPRDSYLTCVQDKEEDRLIVIIVHDVWSSQTLITNKSGEEDIPFDNPRVVPKMLAEKSDNPTMLYEQSLTSFSDGSRDTFAKLLVLEFFLASIYLQRKDYFGPLIYPDLPDNHIVKYSPTKNPHLQVPLGLFEPRLSANSKEAFKEIEDAEGILRSVNNLVDSTKWVLKALRRTNSEDSQDEEYANCIQELEGLCEERQNNAKRALEALERQLDYLTKRHAIRESKSIKTLTILASVYLPLSLSASILGMQSPFKAIAHDSTSSPQDLTGTNLLFDFFGVFIGLSSGTIFILYGIRLGLWAKSTGLGMLSKQFSGQFSILHYGRRWRYGGRSGNVFEVIRVSTAWWIGAGFCITLLTIFLVGMLRTAQNAWDTARWMFATYCIVSGVLLGLYFGTYWFLHLKNIRGR